MKIETKFNIGDWGWVFSQGKIKQQCIISIKFDTSDYENHLAYFLQDEVYDDMEWECGEDELYKTKAQLIASMQKAIKNAGK